MVILPKPPSRPVLWVRLLWGVNSVPYVWGSRVRRARQQNDDILSAHPKRMLMTQTLNFI